MANFGDILNSLAIAAGQSVRRNAGDTAFETFVPFAGNLTNAHIFIGNVSNVAADVAMSGDATIVNTGVLTIANKAVTLAKMDDMATASLIYRKTAGSGAPEVNSLATLKTDLGTMPPAAHTILSHSDAPADGTGWLHKTNGGAWAISTPSASDVGAVPTSRTVNGKALSSNIVLGLASADFVNQGTTTTVLHGNAAGNPSFASVVEADLGLTDLLTANVSTSAHGLAHKAVAPTGSTINFYGITAGQTAPSWMSASDGNGANAVLLQTNSSGGISIVSGAFSSNVDVTNAGGATIRLNHNSATGAHVLQLVPANLTGNRTVTFPDSDVTFPLTAAQTGAITSDATGSANAHIVATDSSGLATFARIIVDTSTVYVSTDHHLGVGTTNPGLSSSFSSGEKALGLYGSGSSIYARGLFHVGNPIAVGSIADGTYAGEFAFIFSAVGGYSTTGGIFGTVLCQADGGNTGGKLVFGTRKDGTTGVRGTFVLRADGSAQYPAIGTTASAANAYLDSGASNNLLRSTSSLRYKNVVAPLSLNEARKLVLGLKPIRYTSKAEADNPQTEFVGLGAEDVELLDVRFITRDTEGRPDWVMYPHLVAPLALVVQNQQRQIAELQKEIERLKAN